MQSRKNGKFDFKYAQKLASKLIAVRLFAGDKEKIEKIAQAEKITETEVIRRIVNEYLAIKHPE